MAALAHRVNQTFGSSFQSFTRREWAWEFLRRNPDFKRDWKDAADRILPSGKSLPAGIAGPLDKWGVLFLRLT